MHMFLTSILLIVFNFICDIQMQATSLCIGNSSSHLIQKDCDSYGGSMVFRCCRSEDNQTFIAIDLTNLNYVEVPDLAQILTFNLTAIDLRNNSELKPSKDKDFLTLTYLDDLLLPETFPCPGGSEVWKKIETVIDPPGNRCRQQENSCFNSTNKCNEKNSECVANGPGHVLCLCKDGHHGYKCLRYGQFPSVAFFATTIPVTILTSALLFWAKRRNRNR